MNRWFCAVIVVAGLLYCSSVFAGQPKTNEELFDEGVAALEQTDHERAVAVFESLADRGYRHPDVSYNRAMAYLARVRAKQGRPGDLGRAAAGFEEVLLLRPSDESAQHALEVVRAEVARLTPKSNRSDVVVNPSLDRIIVGLLSESVWAWGAIVGSGLLSVGLVLRRRRIAAMHLAGVIAISVGAVVMVVFGVSAGWSRYLRETTVPAVVVGTDVRFVDDRGVVITRELPIPEAARVEVLERRGGLSRVRYGQREGWVHGGGLWELGS